PRHPPRVRRAAGEPRGPARIHLEEREMWWHRARCVTSRQLRALALCERLEDRRRSKPATPGLSPWPSPPNRDDLPCGGGVQCFISSSEAGDGSRVLPGGTR